MNERLRTAAFLALTGIVQAAMFFSDPRHFFQGDTMTWMYLRYRTLGDFLIGFTRLDQGGWYRPLTQRTVQSVLFPFFGLNPVPYRILTFALFFGCTVLVFFVIRRLTRSPQATCFGTLFFALHVTHAYTAFDTAFTPEILYTFFALGSMLAFLAYCDDRGNRNLVLSILFVILSLMSKETALTTPFLLLLARASRARDRRPPFVKLVPHFVVLAAYMVFAVGYLHVGGISISNFFKDSSQKESSDYDMSVSGLIPNARRALSWGFNLPGSEPGPWRFPESWMSYFLSALRVCALLAIAAALLTSQRRLVVIGIVWFWLVSMPALPLAAHFLPYYLFGPVVGLSLAIGVSAGVLFTWLQSRARVVGMSAAVAVFGMLAAVNANAAWIAAREQGLLGRSAQTNANAIANLKAMRPLLKPGTTLVIANEDFISLSWSFGTQGLFRLAYRDETINTAVTATRDEFLKGDAVALRFGLDTIQDVTKAAIDHALNTLDDTLDAGTPYVLELSRAEVRAGDFYVMRVPELPNASITVLYKTPAGNREFFRTKLDGKGAVRFDVGRGTPTGSYTFLALRPESNPTWRKVQGTVVVQ